VYRRTDHFDCGHTYIVDKHGRDLKIAKCPQCGIGEYDGSLVESDEPEARRVEPADTGATIFGANPTSTGVFNTPWAWAASTASVSPQPYADYLINPPQTVGNGGTVAFNGSISDVTIYDRALYSDSEWNDIVRTHYDDPPEEDLPEGHPLPPYNHNPETCEWCIRWREDERIRDEETDIETHTYYEEVEH
jgi:hypothetical protein